MNNDDLINTIVEYGLSIRQIPYSVSSCYEIRHFKEGDKIIERTVRTQDGFVKRQYCVRTNIPKNAGYWMCRQVKSTNSQVQWDSRIDNLAPTLEESVQLFLKNRTDTNADQTKPS